MKNPFTWFRRSRLDDISDEIRSHIEEKTDALVAAGMSRADAEGSRGAPSVRQRDEHAGSGARRVAIRILHG